MKKFWQALVVLDHKLRHGPLCDSPQEALSQTERLGQLVMGVYGGSELNAGHLAAVSRCLGNPD